MSEIPEEANKSDELKKLAAIATDMELDQKMRIQAIELLGNMRTHEALLVLLNLAANEKLSVDDRDLALKRARETIKSGH